MPLRQIQVANDSIQDRLVLRVGTQANEEFRIYITRRFLREIWPHLTAMLNGHFGTSVEQAPLAAAQPSGEPANFDQPFRAENPTYPLGSTPLLASEATMEAIAEGEARLILRESRERSFTLKLHAELLQALCAMLRAASEQANWDLALDYGQPTPRASHGSQSSFLH